MGKNGPGNGRHISKSDEKPINMQLNFYKKFALGWLVLVVAVMWFGVIYLPFKPTFSSLDLLKSLGPRILTVLAQFDGVHYLTIVLKGYKGTGLVQAFFPGYPLAVWLTSINGWINPIIVGSLISVTCFFTALWFLIKLVRMDESSQTAKKTVLLLMLFPTSFYFILVYSESLFLMLIILSFYCLRQKRWFAAGLFGAVAAFTRLAGIFIVPAMLVEWYLDKNRNWIKLAASFFPILGLLSYMGFLQVVFGNPIMFYSVQTGFGASRETSRLILLPQVFWRYGKMLLSPQVNWHARYTVTHELVSGVIGITLSITAFFKTRLSYAVFACLSFILPTLTGTFSSMPRYLVVIFPLFMVAAKIVPPKIFPLVLVVSGILLVINILLFTQGLWVA